MNTFVRGVASRFHQAASLVFGELVWRPLGWARELGRRASRHWRALVILGLLLGCAAGGGWWTWRWWQGRPKPRFVAVRVEAPSVMRLQETLRPDYLELRFSESAARLDLVGKKLPLNRVEEQGVRLEPALPGVWEWASDCRLRFTPRDEWPADLALRVVLLGGTTVGSALAPHVRLERYDFATRTPPFTGGFTQAEFYQDPQDPAIKQVTATLEFSHPVELRDLEEHLALKLLGDSAVFRSAENAARPFTLTPGLHARRFYLRTAALTLPEREDFLKITLAPGLRTTLGGAALREGSERKVRVPDLYSFFRIAEVVTRVVRNKEGEPEQFLIVRTTAAAKSEDIGRGLQLLHLPKINPRRHDANAQQANAESDDDEEEEAASRRHGRRDRDEDENENAEDESEGGDNNVGPANGDTHTAAGDDRYDDWSLGEVDADALALALPLTPALVPAAREHSTEHTFRFRVESPGHVWVKIAGGVRALGGFALRDDYCAVAPVPQPEKEVEIQGAGGVLALGGERKLSIKSRGVSAIRYEIARVPAAQINHLVSQTEGDFQNPAFRSRCFDEENLARVTVETQRINLENAVRANFSAFDFTAHLRPADGAREGLFFLTARAWDPAKNKQIGEVGDRRFVLVTNLGLLVKTNADGSRDAFVQSLADAKPVAGATVEILGKNGVPLATATTDADGRASLPSLGATEKELPRDSHAPVAITARRGDDVAFLPFRPRDRQLDFSRWDIGGVRAKSGAELDAFVFTERGVYRPGDELHAGVIVKRRDWGALPEGVPLETEVLDARGLVVQVKRHALPASGFIEFDYATAYESPTGPWTLNVFLTRADGKRGTLLGTASVQVKEFLPDRLKIETRLSKNSPRGGWVSSSEMRAAVELQNLYGTPAENHRIKAQGRLQPRGFRFPEFAAYTFYDRLREGKKPWEGETIELGEKQTNEHGATEFALGLERFSEATFRLTFVAEGFEAEGGRSVQNECAVFVSSLPHIVGWKADGALDYITVGSDRAVEFIALDPALNRIALENVTAEIIEQIYVSVLSRRENGNYEYESVLREKSVSTAPVKIAPDGLKFSLLTRTPGNYVLELRDAAGARLSKLAFCIVGQGAVSRSLDKDAELEIKLSKTHFRAGDTIEISLAAPYAGSGLITIERDRVYAHRWFQTRATSSVQTITIPADFDGTGYVNVAFIRAPDSKEIFANPLSCGVAPFTANLERRRLGITLDAAAKAKPGEPLTIRYRTDRPAKVVVYAVDQGILQVTNYKLPDPLAHLFRKSALLVKTTQLLDLILPEFSILRAAGSAPGGDDDEPGVLNPFRRVTEKPVVFWSGVLEADTTEREVVYRVPDYFSGTLALMAVAVSPDAVGSARRDTLVRGPFVLTAGVPTLAAPGDQFEVGVTVANGVVGSGPDAAISFTAESSEHLEILGSATSQLRVSEGREATATFRVRVKDKLGSATLGFRAALASGGEETSSVQATLSVRPPTPFMTEVRGGNFTGERFDAPVERTALHDEFRQLHATISALPLGLAHGLQKFLQDYPNGCTEQLTSAAFARVALAGEADFGLTRAEVSMQLEKTFAVLRRRQNDQGAFGYWSAAEKSGGNNDFVTVYVVYFLSEAKAAGFAVPDDLFARGKGRLQKMVSAVEPGSLCEARTLAYAIYVLTREGIITTNYLLNLRDWLDHHAKDRWQRDLTGVYLASALALLKKEDDAQRLIAAYRLGAHDAREFYDFHTGLGADSQFVALLAQHFPARVKSLSAADFEAVLRPIGSGGFNTLSAAYATLALKSYSRLMTRGELRRLGIGELARGGSESLLQADGSDSLRRAAFSASAAALRFHAAGEKAAPGLGAWYQIVEAGFDRGLPDKAIAEGMEVQRELLGAGGQPMTQIRLGERVTVRLRVRSLGQQVITNAAILDLLPGGFEIVGGSLQPGIGGAGGMDFVEVREDRAVFFGTVTPRVREIRYEIKPVNRGEFTVPPPFAESMYDRALHARGLPGRITVVETK